MRLFLGFLIGGGLGIFAGSFLSANFSLVTGFIGAIIGVNIANRGRRKETDGGVTDGDETLWDVFGGDDGDDSGDDGGDD